jgi:hypothetical protein
MNQNGKSFPTGNSGLGGLAVVPASAFPMGGPLTPDLRATCVRLGFSNGRTTYSRPACDLRAEVPEISPEGWSWVVRK